LAPGVAEDGEALEAGSRVDVYLFFSFDLVGSSRLKAQHFDRFHWVELFQYFHSECRRQIASRGVENAVVWKYQGDEVLFYQRIGTAYQVEHTIRAIDRALAALMQDLGENVKYAEAVEYISIRAIAWTAPVLSFAESISEKMRALVAELDVAAMLPDDQMIHDRENNILDFLGPNIDTGFLLASSARSERITISPALADFLRGTERPILDAIIEAGD
jgi:hypothetical protein